MCLIIMTYLQNFQQKAYPMPFHFDIQDYIKGYSTLSEEEAYENSLLCEPRQLF